MLDELLILQVAATHLLHTSNNIAFLNMQIYGSALAPYFLPGILLDQNKALRSTAKQLPECHLLQAAQISRELEKI